MIEDSARLHPSLTFDWSSFDELMRKESRQSRLFSVYNKTMKSSQITSQHPLEAIVDLLKETQWSQSTTIDNPFKYHADKSISADIQLLIEIDDQQRPSLVHTVDRHRKYYVLLDRTSFYATAGGQSSDRGTLQSSDQAIFHVEYETLTWQCYSSCSCLRTRTCSPFDSEMCCVCTMQSFTTDHLFTMVRYRRQRSRVMSIYNDD
jgi:alanyl-tRNA synthetase